MILSVLVLMLFIVTATYFVLKSGTLTQTAVTKINPIAEPFGVKILALESAQIDLLGFIDIRGLSLSWKDRSQGQASVTASHIRLDYSLGDLFKRKLQIHEILLSGIDIKTAFKPIPTKETTKPSKPLSQKDIEQLIASPPVPIQIQRLALENITFDIVMTNKNDTQHLVGKLNSLDTKLQWNSQHLKFGMAVQINPEKEEPWTYNDVAIDNSVAVKFYPDWDTQFRLNLNYSLPAWSLDQAELVQKLALKNFSLTQKQKGLLINTLTSNAINMELDTNKQSIQGINNESGLKALLPLKLVTNFKTNIRQFNTNLDIPKKTLLNSAMNNQLAITLNNSINSFVPTQVATSYQLDEVLNLNKTTFRNTLQTLNLKQLLLKLSAKGKANLVGSDLRDIKNSTELSLESDKMQFYQHSGHSRLNIELVPSLALNAHLVLPALNQLKQLQTNVQINTRATHLAADITQDKKTQKFITEKADLNTNIQVKQNLANVNTHLAMNKLVLPQLTKPITLENTTDLLSDLNIHKVSLTTELKLQKNKILNGIFTVNNENQQLDIKHKINLALPLWLKTIHKQAKSLALIGNTKVTLTGNTLLKHHAENIQQAKMSNIDNMPVKADGEVKVVQLSLPTRKDGVQIKGPLKIEYEIDKRKKIKTFLNITSGGIKTGPLLALLPFVMQNRSEFTWPLTATTTNGFLNIKNENALKYNLHLIDKKKHAHLMGLLSLSEDPQWQQYIAFLKATDDVGKLTLALKTDIQLMHDAKSILNLKVHDPTQLNSKINLNFKVSQDKNKPGKKLVLEKPVQINNVTYWKNGDLIADVAFNVGHLKSSEVVEIKNLPGRLHIQTNGGLDPDKVKANLELQSGVVNLFYQNKKKLQTLKVGKLITPFTTTLDTQKESNKILINHMNLDAGKGLLQVALQGNAGLKGDMAQLILKLTSNLNNNQLKDLGISSQGKFNLPLQLNYSNKGDLSLKGALEFNHLSLTNKQLKIQNINGKIPLNEELLTNGKWFAFKYNLRTDPFQREDFSRIQPYLNTENNVSFHKIQMNDISLGPGMINLALNQNLVDIHRMDMDALKGHILARLYFDLTPGDQRIGMLGRISGLDVRPLLPKNAIGPNSTYAPISTRFALNFTLAQRLMEGKVDVAQISKDQLLQLLEFVDPEHKDEQIDTVRTALRFAYPESISVEMVSGLMNLAVKISTLPNAIQVRGLPLTPLIQQSAGNIETLLADLPLKNRDVLTRKPVQ